MRVGSRNSQHPGDIRNAKRMLKRELERQTTTGTRMCWRTVKGPYRDTAPEGFLMNIDAYSLSFRRVLREEQILFIISYSWKTFSIFLRHPLAPRPEILYLSTTPFLCANKLLCLVAKNQYKYENITINSIYTFDFRFKTKTMFQPQTPLNLSTLFVAQK